jgi:serine/threonine protein kinase
LKVKHRDLKPENVLCNGASGDLVVADFGVAEFTGELLYTLVETADDKRLANFVYAAPEQKIRGSTIGYGADIFSLGLILNELFTKVVPHGTGHTTIGSVVSNFAFLDPIVSRMLAAEPL